MVRFYFILKVCSRVIILSLINEVKKVITKFRALRFATLSLKSQTKVNSNFPVFSWWADIDFFSKSRLDLFLAGFSVRESTSEKAVE